MPIIHRAFPSRMTTFGFAQKGDEMTAKQKQVIPCIANWKRVGVTQDLAGITLFLPSSASAHVAGAHILLDGGYSIGSQIMPPATTLWSRTPPSGTLPANLLTPNPVNLSSNSKELQKSSDGSPSFAQCTASILPLQHYRQKLELRVRWRDPYQPAGGQRTPLPRRGTQRVPLSHLKIPWTHDSPCYGELSQIDRSSHEQWQTLLPYRFTVYPVRGGHYRWRFTWLNYYIPFTT